VGAVVAAAVVEEVEGGGGCFGGVDVAVSEPGFVVDADEEVVPACFAFGAPRPAGQRVAGALDAAQALDVYVHELAGPLALVAHHRFFGLLVEARLAVAAKDRVHGRGGEAELPADRVRAYAKPPARVEDRLLDPRRCLSRRSVRSARAVDQAFAAAVAADPLRRRLPRATRQPRRGSDRPAAANQLDQTHSLAEAESSISMNKQEPSLWL